MIFADEPTGNLDRATGKQILQVLKDLNQSGVTIVIVTHDPAVADLANRTVHIQDGKIQQ